MLEKPKKFKKLEKIASCIKTVEICDSESWKLIHGQITFSSKLLSNPNGDFLFGCKPEWQKNWKNASFIKKNAKIPGVEILINIPLHLEKIR